MVRKAKTDDAPSYDSYSSDSDASSHVDIEQGESRKRRKISPTSTLGVTTQAPLPSISRIKPKAKSTTAKEQSILSLSSGPSGTIRPGFDSLGLSPWLVTALGAMSITRPTPIQRECIPEIINGRDCIGGSRTGSGKTVAFAVPILQKWSEDPVGIYAVILTPTRELALQIFEQIKAISAPQNLKPILVTGGADMRAQAIALAQRPHIVIATPGRLADHINTSGEDTVCGLRRVKFVVFDEADRLLSAGPGSMLPDIETCLSVLPPGDQRQTCLFTATVTPEVHALKDMPRAPDRPPVFVCEVDTGVLAIPPTLQQYYLQVPVTFREPYLQVLLTTPVNLKRSIIIFCNRTSTANLLEHMLRLLDHRVTALHSKLPQAERISNLARFRARAARVLVATDVAARGLDIPEVAMVINFDIPRDPDDYIHRVGRTARAGRTGDSVTFVGQRDVDLVLATEARVGRKMTEYTEEGVSIEGRVVREALRTVGEKTREAMLQIEEGRDVKGKRRRGMEKLRAL